MHSNSKIKRWTWNGCLHNVNVFPYRMTVITVIRQAFSVRSLTPDGSVRDTTPTATRSHSTVASLNTTDTKSQALCPDTDHMAHPTLETPTRHTTTLVTATLDIAHLMVDSLMLTDSQKPWTINKYSAVFFAYKRIEKGVDCYMLSFVLLYLNLLFMMMLWCFVEYFILTAAEQGKFHQLVFWYECG